MLELKLVQQCVQAAGMQQLLMSSALGNSTALYKKDGVRTPNRRKAMGNHNRGLAFHQASRASNTNFSEAASRPELGSSMIRIGVSRMIARAIAMR